MSASSQAANRPHPEASAFQHILMLLVPDGKATAIGITLVAASFVAGFLEMLSQNIVGAELYFYFAIGLMAFLITMKYMSLRANQVVAQASHQRLIQQLREHHLQEQLRVSALSSAEKAQAAKAKAEERREMMKVAETLQEALKHIDKEDPRRTKYEASIKLMEKVLGHE